ncbi:MAG: phosphatidylserine decarboxylase family protein [Desulfuromonadales bacterium]|uniref:phosphatidylserine decarboxylase family protein n=1 Tax=Desulfuromonas sp. KJ2020 TaxID=2919173 RepID=UPI0020A72558|nr:phosphatidylserine decarboxylase family protein [Desulfuromonas sp. KJ2020]MCP3177806.1 phosphatidylserine decarboxylase family protein [Desulfuromonas sp. KJ2020]
MRNQNQIVAVEGYPFIGIFAFVTLVFALLDWGFLTFVSLCLTLFTVYFFRNPERHLPPDEEAVVAPADGKIIFVGNVMEERFFKEEVTKVSIFMSVFNVHVNRVPFPGKVLDMFYNKGEFFNASLDKASLQNEQAGILLETPGGQKLLFVQIAGLVARRIVTYPVIGSILEKGARYGLIRFGSRVDIYFPPGAEVTSVVGDNTIGGETVIGYIR